jgi:Leucine-rich repeat (LRR) protein
MISKIDVQPICALFYLLLLGCEEPARPIYCKENTIEIEKLNWGKTYFDIEIALTEPLKVERFCTLDTNIVVIPVELLQFPRLVDLSLSYKKLKILPSWITGLKTVKIINLSSNEFKKFPNELLSLRQLKEIDFWGNDLTYLPQNFGNLVQLKKLNLSANNLTRLPKSFASLDSITFLMLDLNDFKIFPKAICYMKNLERLHIRSNDISEYPKEIGKLTKLVELVIDDNRLDYDQIMTLRKLLPCCRIFSYPQNRKHED